MTLHEALDIWIKSAGTSPAQRAVNSGAPNAAENPSDAQKATGNYRKVHLNLDGYRISIENPKGSVRSGTAPDGTKWSNTLACDYGDIRGTESVDGDPVDVYLSDHPEKGAVFVIDQIDPRTGEFDEHKVMYGFNSVEEATKTYLACYQKGWKGLGWITPVTKAEFKKWIASSNRKTKPFHEYKSVDPIMAPIPSDSLGFLKKENLFVNKAAFINKQAQTVPINTLKWLQEIEDQDKINLDTDTRHFFDTIVPYIKSHSDTAGTPGVDYNSSRFVPGFYRSIDIRKQPLGGTLAGLSTTRGVRIDPGAVGNSSILVHELKHQQNQDGLLDYFALKNYFPFFKTRYRKSGRSAADDKLLSDVYHFTQDDVRPYYPGEDDDGLESNVKKEQGTTHAQHQFEIMRELKEKLGRNPTGEEFVDYVRSADMDALNTWRQYVPNAYQQRADIRKNPYQQHYRKAVEEADKIDMPSWVDYASKSEMDKYKKQPWYDSDIFQGLPGGDPFDKTTESGIRGGFDPKFKWIEGRSKQLMEQTRDSDLESFRRALMNVAKNKVQPGGGRQHPTEKLAQETASGHRAKQEAYTKEQEKTAQAKQDDPMDGVPKGVKLRGFTDAAATRQALYDNMLDAVRHRFPIEDDDIRIELDDVKYEGPTEFNLSQQKKALLSNRKLAASMVGTWRMVDKKTGKVLDERRDAVMRVPFYTNRGTIIHNGNDYTVINQSRLSPGVYTRRKQNGELESQFNVANGKGFRIGLNRETGALNMSVGQAHIPLYPVLRAFGITDEQMSGAWGPDIVKVNSAKRDPKAMSKLYARYAGYKANENATESEKTEFVRKALSESGLDPDVMVRTLGIENASGVTPEIILAASQKLLNVNRKVVDPDQRDNPRFSKFYGIEDIMRERVDKDAGRLTKSILFRAKRDKNLGRIPRNALSQYIDSFLSGSGLAQPGEEANPMSILAQQSRITKLGEGGIKSSDLVTPEARNVQGDYLGYVDFLSGPESENIGIDVRASLGTMKGSDHRLYNKMIDMHTGKTRYVALNDAAAHTVAFPGQDPNSPRLAVMRNGVPTMVPRDEVDFMVPSFANTVSSGINMTPMPTATQGSRIFYSSKFWDQYLPQKKGELPMVDSLTSDGKTTFGEYYGRKVGCITAPFAGTVVKVNDNEVTIRGKDGRTYTADMVKDLPFNRMTSISYYPTVKKGDEIAAGGMLAHSNFTDSKTGALNMGQNLKVCILPAPRNSSSFEDAQVISESAAKRLATTRTHGFDQDTKNGVKISRDKFISAFPKSYTRQQVDTMDENGVVKVGTVLHRDDPIIMAIGPKLLSAEDAQVGKLSSVLRNALTDKSTKWEHDWPGVVTDVVAGPHGAQVLVKSEPPVQVADKLSPRMALKGTVANILPDDKMPRDAVTNEPYDMVVNPMGFLSRVAPGQVMEIALGKVAKKTGKQFRIPQTPPPEGWYAWTKKQLDDNGVKETADVFDPQTGRTIKNVGDGYMYVQAFHHLAEKKYSARGIEGAYTQDEQPAKGGIDGAKRMSSFDVNSLLSHGATEVLKDAMTTRGSMNSEYWRKLRLGLPIEEPGVPFVYTKFMNMLRAGGVNVVDKGDVTQFLPQTDKDIDRMAEGRVIKSSQMVDANMNPVAGGLYDLGSTGGAGGKRWSMITLPEAVPNPIMEEPVRRLLGLTAKDLENVLSGRKDINGKSGGDAIKEALSKIDIDKEMDKARYNIKTKRGSERDNAIKVLGYLKAAKDNGIAPSEWMITRVPVLPPAFRPVSRMGDVALIPDINELYRDLIESKQNFGFLRDELPLSALADERLNIYKAVKAAYGLGNPVTTEGQAKNLKGMVRQIIGTVPKWGMFQSKVVSKAQDLVGRGVISPDRNLDMDQIGIPEEMAWTMYKPFVTRELVRRGFSPTKAVEMIDAKSPAARHVLDDTMKEKPVLMDRAPTWHKFNIMAFRPHIVDGRNIHICPLICSGFNADFDGDQQIGSVVIRLKNKAWDDFNKSEDVGCINLKTLLKYQATHQGRSCQYAN